MGIQHATLDHLLAHMAWANAALFKQLEDLPTPALSHTAPGSEWSVGAIAHHLVTATRNDFMVSLARRREMRQQTQQGSVSFAPRSPLLTPSSVRRRA